MGLKVERDGVVVEVPIEVESAGGATLDAYVVNQVEGAASLAAPAAAEEEE